MTHAPPGKRATLRPGAALKRRPSEVAGTNACRCLPALRRRAAATAPLPEGPWQGRARSAARGTRLEWRRGGARSARTHSPCAEAKRSSRLEVSMTKVQADRERGRQTYQRHRHIRTPINAQTDLATRNTPLNAPGVVKRTSKRSSQKLLGNSCAAVSSRNLLKPNTYTACARRGATIHDQPHVPACRRFPSTALI